MTEPFGVYIHIPFCARRCDYCAFATWDDRHHLRSAYLEALGEDIARSALPPVTSVFVGGGTPTQVDPAQLAEVLARIPTVPGAEVTVECNPDDVTVGLLRTYREAGVNRVSIGVQSMVPHVLGALGRDPPTRQRDHRRGGRTRGRHSNVQPRPDLRRRGGVARRLARTLSRAVLELDPPHVSAYALTIEPGTPLAAQPERHPDDDDLADKYELADDLLTAAGLANYEISNWARPGHECRHNILYWQQGDYIGFGSAAHSHRSGRRWWNVRTPERYIASVTAGHGTEAGSEVLDAATRRLEGLQLALRMRDGVPAEALDVDGLDGLVESDGRRVRLTRRGRLLANEVSLRLS